MKKLLLISSLLFSSLFLFTGCEENDATSEPGLTNDEVIEGLKAALREGTDSSTSVLSLTDGYFKDQAIKLLLPDEIETAISSFKAKTITLGSLPIIGDLTVTGSQLYNGYSDPTFGIDIKGVKQKEDDLILGLNRAAEFAAKSAKPVFVDAITGMSVTDGLSILNGADTSATTYLKDNTYSGLFNSYEPIMDDALNSVKVGDKSVVALYEDYVSSYNDILNYSAAGTSVKDLANVNTIATTDLSKHGTEKALDGLFLKVSEEEKNIRLNPFQYISDIIQKVFGSLFD